MSAVAAPQSEMRGPAMFAVSAECAATKSVPPEVYNANAMALRFFAERGFIPLQMIKDIPGEQGWGVANDFKKTVRDMSEKKGFTVAIDLLVNPCYGTRNVIKPAVAVGHQNMQYWLGNDNLPFFL